MANNVKLKLPNGRVIERPEGKVTRLFLRAGAVEITATKPKEVLRKITPPPVREVEPVILKPVDDYPKVEDDKVLAEKIEPVKTENVIPKPKAPAKKKSTKKTKK